jgi:branched-subunit amino acid aminotransferase/4-amino-4-deoxychorismate lyase
VSPREVAWIDGRLASAAEAARVIDPEVAHGVGLIETIGARAGRFPLFARHVERLRRSAPVVGITGELPEDLEATAEELVERAGRTDGIARIVWTARPQLVLMTRDRVELGRPLRLRAASTRRGPGVPEPAVSVKTVSRRFYDAAQREARAAGGDDALILGPGATVLETAIGNVFARFGGSIRTPAQNGAFLAGIARAVLIERLADLGFAVEQRALSLADLAGADAIWVCNAVYGPRRAVLDDSTEVPVEQGDPLAEAWRLEIDGAPPSVGGTDGTIPS